MIPTSPAAVPVVPAEGLWRRLTRGRWVVHQEPDWEAFAGHGWLERIMSESVTDRFHAKQGRSIGRWTLTNGDRSLVVYLKRHYVLSRWRGLLAALWPGRAWSPGLEEWEHLAWAKANGLPVPRPVAVGEYRGPWGRLQSFLAVEELTGMLPLHEAIPRAAARLGPADFDRWKRGLIAELVRLTRELHHRGAFHQDLYLCHFYIPEADTERVPPDWAGIVHLIDFHRLTFRGMLRQGGARVKDLAQLLFSTFDVPGITLRDRLRFWRLYRGRGRQVLTRMFQGAIRVKAERYASHNARTS